MMEIKVTVVLPGIPEAINNLASAISKQAVKTNTTEQVIPAQTIPTSVVQETAAPTQAPAQMGPADTATTVTVPPTEPTATIPQSSPELTPAPTKKYTLEEIANAGSALVTLGKMNDLLALLKKFGVQSVAHLPEEQYGAFAEDLKALGAAL